MKKKSHKIVLIGGPGTGKSSVINELLKRGYSCKQEISREVTLQAKKEGIEQLFLKDPLLFSRLLLEGRIKQFSEAEKSDENIIFFDRGIPDVSAYLDFVKEPYSKEFLDKNKEYAYDTIFYFKPWEVIYTKDNERYESFEEATKIDRFLINTYSGLGYKIIEVPFETVSKRTDFILNSLNCE